MLKTCFNGLLIAAVTITTWAVVAINFQTPCLAQDATDQKFEYTVFPLDPVELINGKEVKGDADIAFNHHRFKYHFINDANRKAFTADPAKYEIQMGGACARMGALNTGGQPDIYTVYNDRIYLFASKACRTGFLRNPDRLLDRDDEEPVGDVRAIQFGRQWLEQVVAAAGGKEKLDKLNSISQKSIRKKKYGDREYAVVNEFGLKFNGNDFDAYMYSSFDEETYAKTLINGKGNFGSTEGNLPMHDQQLIEMREMMLRKPLVILKLLNHDDMIAVAHQIEEGSPVKYVSVHIDNTTTELGIDIKSNRIVSTRFQGRGPNSSFGEIKCQYSGFETIDGMTLPTKVATTFDGAPYDDESLEYSIEINKPIDWSRF